ncbi:hypothetical protein MAC_05958 [Metarhizium acridum CQMa 102]|uniref:Uncharacterized protein n=1 Tax=Metarhizium acridum (strain CQMa 102) TaxID=655827 RepID=E9E7W0_METAQ|nr:uncharacterized protein MAC_05958 [Metarhizium acridum CQMa 102]EFY87967.1 hypothetical protein MAC_05958 [Metarhizium acridum CQMa 102]
MVAASEGDPTPTTTVPPGLTLNLGPLTTTFAPPGNCTSLTLGYYGHRVSMSMNVTTVLQWNRGYECPTTYGGSLFQLISSCFPERYGPAYNNIQDWRGPDAPARGHPADPDLLPDHDVDVSHRVHVEHPVQGADGARLLPEVSPVGPGDGEIIPNQNELQTVGSHGASGFRCYAPYTCISTPPLSATVTADMSQGCPSKSMNRTTSTQLISSDIWPFVFAPQVVLVRGNDTATAAASGSSGPSTTSSASGDGDARGGLSTATKAAIGTALPLILIVLALAGYVFYRRRSRSKAEAGAASEQESGLPGMNKPELDATPSPFGPSLGPESELDGTPRGADSTSAGHPVSELPGSGAATAVGAMCELPGDGEFATRTAQPRESDGIAADDEEGETGQGASINGASEPKAHDTKEHRC